MAAANVNDDLDEIMDDFSEYLMKLVSQCDHSEQDFIEAKNELLELIGQDNAQLMQYNWRLSVQNCNEIAQPNIDELVNRMVAGLTRIRTEGNQDLFDDVRHRIDDLLFPAIFHDLFGHPAPAPGHVPQVGGRRRRSRSIKRKTKRSGRTHRKNQRRHHSRRNKKMK